MSITTDRIAKANGIGKSEAPLDAVAKSHLFDALAGALDSIAIGVVIVAEQGRIMHANHAAQEMLAAKSPIMALGNCLCALQAEITKELRRAIAAAQADPAAAGASGIGVPLIDKSMNVATAHVLPLTKRDAQTRGLDVRAPVAVLVTPPSVAPPVEMGTVARLFKLTPAEARLLVLLVSGASLTEAAVNLGIAEATARTHRNHIFTKTGVSRRTDLMVLIGRLLPPIRRAQRLTRTV